MTRSLQEFVQGIVESAKLKDSIKHEVSRELTSHVIEEEKELQLQGYSEEKIFEIISSQFNKDRMVQEFKQVHKGNLRWGGRIITVVCTVIIFNLIVVFLDSFGQSNYVSFSYKTFGWLTLILTFGFPAALVPFNLIVSIVIFSVTFILKNILVIKNFSLEKAKIIRNYIVGGGLLFNWLALISSFKPRDFPEHQIIEGGFPIKVFDYPWNFPPAEGPTFLIPLSFLPKFLINLVIWFLVMALVYKILPERLKDNKRLSTILVLGGLAATWYGFGFLSWQFMD